jgi:hypothetical protein
MLAYITEGAGLCNGMHYRVMLFPTLVLSTGMSSKFLDAEENILATFLFKKKPKISK